MSDTIERKAAVLTAEREIDFGGKPRPGDTPFGPVDAGPGLTIGGTAWRWVTQLSLNGEAFGSPEGPSVSRNLVLGAGEYINSIGTAHIYGLHSFITTIRLKTNKGQSWTLEHDEAPGKTKLDYTPLSLPNIRLLSLGGLRGDPGDNIRQLKIRYLENYFVEDDPVDSGGHNLYAILDVSPEGSVETFESSESRTLNAITTVNEITASAETEISQSYLLAEATTRLGLSYMNSQELKKEQEQIETRSIKKTINIPSGQLGIGICRVEMKKLKQGGKTHFLIVPTEPKAIFPKTIEEIKQMAFFDLSSNLQMMIPDLKFTKDPNISFGHKFFHPREV